MAPRSQKSLEESVDRLAEAFDRLADRMDSIGGNGAPASDGDRLTNHIRRYMPFYALATVWILMLVLIPTRQSGDQPSAASQVTGVPSTSGSFSGGGSTNFTPGTTTGSGTSASSGSTQVSGASASNDQPQAVAQSTGNVPPEQLPDPLAWDQTGITRGGFECEPGVRQLPWSRYAAPCYPAWEGNNGGATWRGVTAEEVIIVDRQFPESANSRATGAFVEAAGFASTDEFRETNAIFKEYFHEVFELWGRKLTFIEYESEFGDSTQEAQSQGKEGACADADQILERFEPFAVIGDTTHPFGECGAERGMVVLGTGAYYPEAWYDKYHPYLWNGVMECERIAYMNAEYLGKRIANRPAKWAKGLQKDLPRVIGIYVPNNDQYQHCVDIAEREGKEKYGMELGSRYNYALDISRFPDEAARAIVQFNADGVTTVFLACDPISPIFLTQSARSQEYFPEWITNSAGLTDVDQFARLWDQEEIQWSLFGMSQLGDNARILGPEGEGTITYKKATGQDIPPGTQTEYYALQRLFSQFQIMGPIVTPDNLAAAQWRAPPGGAPEFEVGFTSYQDGPDGTPGATDHTAIDDMREIYWLCTDIGGGDAEGASRCQEPKGFDGNGGTYVPTYDGKRFRPGEWPAEDPPVFPEYPG